MSLPGARQLFRSFKRAAPALPYDAEVKWLESTGTQYIDTGITMLKNLFCEVRFCFTEIGNSSNAPFGANNGRMWLAFTSYDTSKTIFAGTHGIIGEYRISESTYPTLEPYEWHVAKIDTTEGDNKASFELDELGKDSRSSVGGDPLDSLYVFGCNGSGVTDRARCRIGYCKIKDTKTNRLLIDLIPVRFTNEIFESEGAMYDKVSGLLFRNKGTGKFIVGADVGMQYDADVAYVQYHSTNFDSDFSIQLPQSVVETLSGKTLNEIDFSFRDTVSRIDLGGNVHLCGVGAITKNVGPYCPSGVNSVYASNSALGSVECQSLDEYHSVGVSISSGYRTGYIDGIVSGTSGTELVGTISSSTLNFIKADKRTTSNTGTKVRQSDIEMRIGTETIVDGHPIVTSDGSIGWYDSVSNAVYTAPSTTQGLTAGPVVSNEGPRPYAYKVQYIETDGVASYIDTGIPIDGSDVRFVFNFAFVGSTSSSSNIENLLYRYQSGWTVYTCKIGTLSPGNSNYEFDTTGDVFNECEVQLFSGNMFSKVDGVTVGTSTQSMIVAHGNFGIGIAWRSGGSVYGVGHVKCAKFQIFDGSGNCKFNGIPVVDRNGIACMYDYVSKTLKYNAASSGTITAGPPIV